MPLTDRKSPYAYLKRGDWLSVRMEIGHYDPILKEDMRIPVGDADCLYDGSVFKVYDSPQGESSGRSVQYHLNRLEPDERRSLMANLKEV
jgi:hypothetical protein